VESIALAAVAILGYGLVSARLHSTPITGPMVFLGVGMLFSETGLGVLELDFEQTAVRVLAEATLVVVLFTDAIMIRLPQLQREIAIPARLLGVGLPLTIVAGTAVGALLLDVSLWEAALIAAILAPTDAALGKAVVTDERIPGRIRQALSTESGINDGVVLPVVTLFLALAIATGSEDPESSVHWLRYAAEQIGFAVLVGAVLGAVGGRAVDHAVRAGWMDGLFRQLSTLAIGVAAFAVSHLVGGNGFIAAFVAGLAFGQVARDQCPHVADFAEDQGELLSLLTFLLFGAALAAPALDELSPQIALYAVLSLTVVRILPVSISLVGARLDRKAVALAGWFGPRGLASILFGIVVLEESSMTPEDPVLLVVTWTVLLSVVVHGMTAAPLARRYGGQHETGPTSAGSSDVTIRPRLRRR
jgi:NhaP-type Na+/H+ or K+/H+ antiporter